MFRCFVTVIEMWRRDHPRGNALSYHSSNVSVWLLVVGRIPLINHETLTYSGSTLLVHLLPKGKIFLFDSVELSPLINNAKNVPVNPSVSVSALMTHRFYSVLRQTILLVNGEPLGPWEVFPLVWDRINNYCLYAWLLVQVSLEKPDI